MNIKLEDVALYIIQRRPGISDRGLCEAIYGNDGRHQQINSECRNMENKGLIVRRGEAPIGNYPA